MNHLAKDKKKLSARLKRIRGQMDAVERALNQEVECSDILQLVAAARGGMNSLMAELMADHLIHHVVEPEDNINPRKAEEELIDIFRCTSSSGTGLPTDVRDARILPLGKRTHGN